MKKLFGILLLLSMNSCYKVFFKNVKKNKTINNQTKGFYQLTDDTIFINKNKFQRYIYIDSNEIILDGFFYLKPKDTLMFLPYSEYEISCIEPYIFAVLNKNAGYFTESVTNDCIVYHDSVPKALQSKVHTMRSIQNNYFSPKNNIYTVRHFYHEHMDETFDDRNIVIRIFEIDLKKGIKCIYYNLKKEKELITLYVNYI